MSAENVTRTIQFSLAPVVMITACALLLNGLLSRYDALNARVRMLGRERLDLLRTGRMHDTLDTERLREIDQQIPDLLHRYMLQHTAIATLYGAIVVFILTMFVIALAVAVAADWAAGVALLVFLTGTGVLLTGILRAAQEIRISQHAVVYELSQISALPITPR